MRGRNIEPASQVSLNRWLSNQVVGDTPLTPSRTFGTRSQGGKSWVKKRVTHFVSHSRTRGSRLENQNTSRTTRHFPPAERVAKLVDSSDLFVFMKGNPHQPMCGFSANTVAMLESLGVAYGTYDILSDETVRSAAKAHAQWPTFPQVYLRGELIGGNDIVSELFASGELAQLVEGLR